VDEGMLSERVITLGDLERATRIWVINSVRGWRPHILNSEIAQLAHL
jgi:para-aminobenzoate synthetase/4-amino-4-deoxychorismate lyase